MTLVDKCCLSLFFFGCLGGMICMHLFVSLRGCFLDQHQSKFNYIHLNTQIFFYTDHESSKTIISLGFSTLLIWETSPLLSISPIDNILDEHPWQDGSASGSSTACQAIACDTALSVTGIATWWAYIPNPEALENQTPEKWLRRGILAKWP